MKAKVYKCIKLIEWKIKDKDSTTQAEWTLWWANVNYTIEKHYFKEWKIILCESTILPEWKLRGLTALYKLEWKITICDSTTYIEWILK